jgi:hypothetical protein
MPTAHASAAAAVTAGWTKMQLDRGASVNPRYETTFEKHLTGQAGQSGGPLRAYGVSNVSAAAADTAALASLNGFRDYRYGTPAAGGNFGSSGGGALTVDVH